MTINFANKYKDKIPTDTIENIKTFFKNKNYEIEIAKMKEPIPGIWWCNLKLKYNGIQLAHSNGKGSTQEYALASGYSELYERYCNFSNNTLGQKINYEKLFELNLQKNGYRLFPDEQYISVAEIKNFPILKDFCDSINDDKNSLEKYLNESYPEGILALPFKGFNCNNTINLPFQLLSMSNGSSGMAAGNSIEEALTQGLSEICEHYVHEQIYHEHRNFYYIDIDNIDLPDYLRHYFNEFHNNNFNYYVYDFSYLYQMPVLGLFMVDTIKHVSYLNLGAAPNFYIALERCCTEIYQGYTILGDSLKDSMMPIRSTDINKAIETSLTSMPLSKYYPDKLIFNSIKVSNYNNKIFLDNSEYTNHDLNNYYKLIFNNKKWEIYYRDFSQSENIKAIKCYVKNIPIMHTVANLNHDLPIEIKNETWNIIFKWNKLMNTYLKTQQIDTDLFLEIQSLKKSDNLKNNSASFKYCFNFDFIHMPKIDINSNLDFDIFFQSLITKNWDIIFQQQQNFPILRDYLTLILYSQHYTKNEIEKISKFYNCNYTVEDINNCDNLAYILNKIYFSLYYEYYISKEYAEIIESFIPVVINNQ